MTEVKQKLPAVFFFFFNFVSLSGYSCSLKVFSNAHMKGFVSSFKPLLVLRSIKKVIVTSIYPDWVFFFSQITGYIYASNLKMEFQWEGLKACQGN